MEDVLDRIIKNQDINAMNKRLIEHAINLYAEKTHFVFELLQNAEDVCATRVVFNQFPNRLEVLHDGIPFTESNLQSLCDAANSDKKDLYNQIGKFGIGFKSVYAICSEVELYSEPANRPHIAALERIAVRVTDYIHPSFINADWTVEAPFTTKFVFPYNIWLYKRPVENMRHDIAGKLRNLGADVLLFMKHIKSIEYSIEGIGKEYDGENIYMLDRNPLGERISKVTTLGETDSKLYDGSYLVFSKCIDDTERSVDIAFSVLEDADGKVIFSNKVSQYISTYFPTKTESKLNFIVQAPFELTPDRSSLKEESDYNEKLLKLLEELCVESIFEIKNRGWLTLEFLSLLPYDTDNPSILPNWHFYSLSKKIDGLIRKEEIIPAIDGSYVSASDAKIARGARLIEMFAGGLLCNLLNQPHARWLSKDFTENSPLRAFHSFLIKELHVEEISSNDLARLIKSNSEFLKSVENDWLASFYSYLSKEVRNLLGKNGDLATIPFVKTSEGDFKAPFITRRIGRTTETVANIYTRPQNSKSIIEGFQFVNEFVQNNCSDFVDALGLPEPDAYDYFIKELEIESGKKEVEDSENIAQVKRAIHYLKSGHEQADELLSGLLRLRVFDTGTSPRYFFTTSSQSRICREKDYNGVSLIDYLSGVKCIRPMYILDEQFYLNSGLTVNDINELEQIGVENSIYESIYESEWQEGSAYCYNKGDFRKRLSFAYIDEVLEAMDSDHRKNEFKRTRIRSAAIFKLLKNVEKHLHGSWQYKKANPEYYDDAVASIVSILGADNKKYYNKWLLTKDGELVNPAKISRYALDTRVYGEVDKKTDIYDLLGFEKTPDDEYEELIQEFLLKFTREQQYLIIEKVLREDTESVFDPEVDEDYIGFPEESIKNLQRLYDKTRQRYASAPKVTYERVFRRIRTSRGRDREHMRYRYRGYCQLCEKPSHYWEVAEVFNNPKKELEEMNLSLCPECASEYRVLRNNDGIMSNFAQEIINANTDADPSIALGERYVRFTTVHLAEIQEILRLERK